MKNEQETADKAAKLAKMVNVFFYVCMIFCSRVVVGYAWCYMALR